MSADTDVQVFWKEPALLKLVKELLHQQLYLIGRDIESKYGNLLIQYGFKKTSAPDVCTVSLYSLSLAGGYRLALRGFGVFIEHDRSGGLFLRRYDPVPRWMPSARFEPIVWLPNQMPATRRVLKDEQCFAITLVNEVFRFFYRYEVWIRRCFGKRYRIGQLVGFRRLEENVVHWDTVQAWEALC